MSSDLSDEEINEIRYIIKDFSSFKATNKNVSSLIDIKISDNNVLQDVSYSNKSLIKDKENEEKFATRSALRNSEKNTDNQIKITETSLKKNITSLEKEVAPSVEVYKDVRGFMRVIKWFSALVAGLSAVLTIKLWDKF